jgi:hypothetical protein
MKLFLVVFFRTENVCHAPGCGILADLICSIKILLHQCQTHYDGAMVRPFDFYYMVLDSKAMSAIFSIILVFYILVIFCIIMI